MTSLMRSLRTHIVDVNPDVNSTLLEPVAYLENRRLRVPLVADEHVPSTSRLLFAIYDNRND